MWACSVEAGLAWPLTVRGAQPAGTSRRDRRAELGGGHEGLDGGARAASGGGASLLGIRGAHFVRLRRPGAAHLCGLHGPGAQGQRRSSAPRACTVQPHFSFTSTQGNWSTNLSGGSTFGYDLLFIVWLANVIGCILQALSVRVGVGGSVDLATAVRLHYHPCVARFLWLITEAAVASTDLAEVLGSAIALNILFGIPQWAGVLVTASDVILLLTLQGRRTRIIEAVVGGLILVITVSLVFTLVQAKAPAGQVALGLLPRARIFTNTGELFNAIGILGATVQPHNIFLHSALVQSRNFEKTRQGRLQAIKYNVVDTLIVLSLATFVNAAILIMSAAEFPGRGVTDLVQASSLLTPALGSAASKLFAVGLLASGQQATLTCTLAGQIVLEGFLGPRAALKPWARRMLTRLAAVVPALLVAVLAGSKGTAYLLNLSQVIQSLALPFCVWPLVRFASSKVLLGDLAAPRWLSIVGWATWLVLSGLNGYLVYQYAAHPPS